MTDDGGERLAGGHDAGAVLRDGVIWRRAADWSPAVQELLRHLVERGFTRAPAPLGISDGRERLGYLPGRTIGRSVPWPAWAHSEVALVQVAAWLRDYHHAVADFVPPVGAVWRENHAAPGPDVVIAHNDAAPYNAVWDAQERLVGFVDWDMAGPRRRLDDLAWVAFSWVPLHARRVVIGEGFRDFDHRRERLSSFLETYGAPLTGEEVLHRLHDLLGDQLELMAARARYDPTYQQMIEARRDDDLRLARAELTELL